MNARSIPDWCKDRFWIDARIDSESTLNQRQIDAGSTRSCTHSPQVFFCYWTGFATIPSRNIDFLVVGEVAANADWEARRLGRMMTNPSDPNEHGNVPLTLTNRIKTIQQVYMQDQVNQYPGLNAVYGFAESGISRDVLLGYRSSGLIPDWYNSNDWKTISGQADTKLDWTLLEIHDWPRFLNSFNFDQNGLGQMKATVGLSYLLTAPGQPIIYYGLEQGVNGICGQVTAGDASNNISNLCKGHDDSLNRQDLFYNGPWRLGSVVPEINYLQYIGPVSYNDTWSDWTTG